MASLSIDKEETGNEGRMWALQQQLDPPMDEEGGRLRNRYDEKLYNIILCNSSFMEIAAIAITEAQTRPNYGLKSQKDSSTLFLLQLAFQSLGVVYGDSGTSPLYVFYNTFPDGIKDPGDVIGALSLIIYSLTLVPLLKYVFIVCRANDNGQGGTFALYSLLCQHAKVKMIPNQDHSDEKLTTYSHSTFHEKPFAAKTKRWLESHTFRKNSLLVLVLVGTCMVIGDGILTSAISVLSSVQGIKLGHPEMSSEIVLVAAIIILVVLFCLQHRGVDKISWIFAPVVLLWFLLIGGIGINNIIKYDSSALRAFSPLYIYRYFKRGRKDSWTSLGGVMLSITGTEAPFADLSHFSVPSIQIALTVVVFPCLLSAYSGQVAYLLQNSDNVADAFYRSIPDSIYWPVLIIATGAAVVASQATIIATFSLIKQAAAVYCFPRVKVMHTSEKMLSHIYIPEINWILMIPCIAVTVGFRNQSQIGNASGIAVVIVMLVTTALMVLIMLLVWRWHWILVLVFTLISLVVEVTFFSALLFKINQGGWVPLVIAAVFLTIKCAWHYGAMKRYEFEVHSKVSVPWILGLGPSSGLVRVPGVGLVYTELATGVHHIFSHFFTNLTALHSAVVFVCVMYLPVHTVLEEERFLVRRIGSKDFYIFRCVARYGYKDLHKKDDDFENKLFDSLFRFVRSMMEGCSDLDEHSSDDELTRELRNGLSGYDGDELSSIVDETISSAGSMTVNSELQANNTILQSNQMISQITNGELQLLRNCRDAGVVHILGNTVVTARQDSSLWKKIAIDYVYALLRKLCMENTVVFNVPHESLLNVGQVIHV